MTDSVPESSWTGLLAQRREQPEVLGLRLPVRPSEHGLTGSFLALGMDQRRWWVKPPNQGEMDFALVTEYVVGKAGTLIGAPTCDNSVIEIGAAFDGWEFAPGRRLRAGLGHGTLEVDAAIEERPNLKYRNEDDNRARQAGIYALHDWCWGSDQQWLHSTTQENSIYSHDHGFYFPPASWRWEAEALRADVDKAHVLGQATDGLRQRDLWDVADALEKVDKMALLSILRRVPRVWPVTDAELETLGWFLERRAGAVAARLRELV